MEERLIEMETRIAFQDEAIRKLTGAVAQHEKELYRIHKELDRLRASLTALEPSGLGRSEDEPLPPHY